MSFEAKRIQQDSILLETLKRDLKRMNPKEVRNLPFHDESFPYILEMLEKNRCQFLINNKEWDHPNPECYYSSKKNSILKENFGNPFM